MSSNNCVNSWGRPWTTEEIISNASNWSLAGDAGLLNYLEAFSENLLSKAEETNDNLNTLLEDLSSASLSLDVVKNEFCSLHNIQFVESRVYEEDETLSVDVLQENVKDAKSSEEERIDDMKEAVLRGIDVVDKYFEKVQVPASDSEDETDFPSFVLRPKDPYLDRPLPHIIGSENWYKKWHVGLLDSSSESETDKVSEKFSDSDSESDLPVQDRSHFKDISNSGSEADLSNRNINHPVANSTFDASVKQPDIFGSSDSEDYNSVPVQAPISNRSFAQELAAKLGNVIEQNTQVIEPEVNKRPIQSAAVPSRTIGNIFCDEPPPIDEGGDTMFGNNNAQQGFFSGSGGLFDDLDNSTSFYKEKKDQDKEQFKAAKSQLPNLFDDHDDAIFNTINSHVKSCVVPEDVLQSVVSKKISGGLFDDDSSEDDLFNEDAKHHAPIKHFLHPVSKTTVPFFDNEPPEIEPKTVISKESNVNSKKPTGGVKIFGSTDLFEQQKLGGLLKPRRQESSESSDKDENINENKTTNESPLKISDKSNDLFSYLNSSTNKQNIDEIVKKVDTTENVTPNSVVLNKKLEVDVKSEKKLKQLSLFDDDDRDIGDGNALFEDDLFANISTKKFTSSLFEEEPLKNNLFIPPNVDESAKQSQQVPIIKERSILFSENVKQSSETNEASEQVQEFSVNYKTANLFHVESDDESNDLFAANVIRKPLQSSAVPVAAPRSSKSVITGKTTSETSEEGKVDDNQKHNIGTESSNHSTVQNTAKNVDNLFKNMHPSTNIDFFDQNPPDDDDDWDTKSENNLFEENDPTLFDNTPEVSSQRSGIFDNEPPSLFYESSGIVRDGSATRVETDDSFNPYASSSRRFSSDIFNDQQSSDSFFVTKNKSHLESQTANSNLGSIQEIPRLQDERSTCSNIDITPSGNIDDLLSDSTVSVANVSLQEQSDFVSSKDSKNDNPNSTQNLSDKKSDIIVKDNCKLLEKPDLENTFNTDLFRHEIINNSKLPQKPIERIESNMKVLSEATNIKPQIATKPNSSSTGNRGLGSDNTTASLQDDVTPKIGSPGKLKHTLNINVNALIPGVSLPKKKDLEKSHSFEIASSHETSVTQISVKSTSSSALSKSTEELTQVKELQKSVERSVESPSDFAEVLPSITKDRVRIPIKRRPSTRKARQQSIRNSGTDFKINPLSEHDIRSEESDIKANEALRASSSVENIFEKPKDIKKQEKLDCNAEETAFDIFADDENAFSSKTMRTTEEKIPKTDFTPQRDEQLNKSQPIPLFDSIDSDPSLFTEKPDIINIETKKAPLSLPNDENIHNTNYHVIEDQPKSSIFGEQRRSVINSDSFESADFKKSDLFDESEEFDDIFSTKKLPPKSNILKKSLFDDELDDDDIFGPPTSDTKSTTNNISGTKAIEKKSTKTRKLENTRVVEDPLSSFND